MAYAAVYEKSKYYDIIFDRDVSHEIDFIQQAFEHHTRRPLQSVIELACGPGYHTLAFAERGLTAWGLDLRGEMLAIGADKAVQRGISANWIEADMTNFQLPEPVDAAIGIFDALTVLPATDLVIQNFQAVARNLAPDGLYILDFDHPRATSSQHYGTYYYRGERDGIIAELIWAVNRPRIDLINGTAEIEIELHVDDHGEKHVFYDTAVERLFMLPQEIIMMAQLSGMLKPIAWYGNFMLDQPLDHSPRSQRMIAVLQKCP